MLKNKFKIKYLIIFTVLTLFLVIVFNLNAFQEKYYKLEDTIQNRNSNVGKNKKGRVESFTFFSQALFGNRKYKVYFPFDYDVSDKKYPVLFLLHGFPGDERQWFINGNLPAVLDSLIENKKINPVIVVTPDGNGIKVKEGLYLNSTLGSQNMEDYIVNDLYTEIKNKFKVSYDRKKWFIGGNSSGGFGAVSIGLKHPDKFSIVLSLSGFMGEFNNLVKNVVGQNIEKQRQFMPLYFIDDLNINLPQCYYLLNGSKDWKVIKVENTVFYNKLISKKVNAEHIELNGVHGWGLWREGISGALEYLNNCKF